jgi:hypothetical protein
VSTRVNPSTPPTSLSIRQPSPSAPVTTPYASTSRPVVGPPMQGTQTVSPAPPLDHATPTQQAPAAASGTPAQAGTSAPVIEACAHVYFSCDLTNTDVKAKPAFFDRKPTQLVETHRSHPEEGAKIDSRITHESSFSYRFDRESIR